MARRPSWAGNYREKPSKCQFVTHCCNAFSKVIIVLLVKMSEHVEVVPQNIVVKRRIKGTESVKKERKRLRLSGLQHTNYKGSSIAAKNPPEIEVIYLCLRCIF